MVKTPLFHGGNRGSTPLRVTTCTKKCRLIFSSFLSLVGEKTTHSPEICGCRLMAGPLPSKQMCAGSNPVSRSMVLHSTTSVLLFILLFLLFSERVKRLLTLHPFTMPGA